MGMNTNANGEDTEFEDWSWSAGRSMPPRRAPIRLTRIGVGLAVGAVLYGLCWFFWQLGHALRAYLATHFG